MSHVTNVSVHSEDRQRMQYNDKNKRKKHYMYLKRQRGTSDASQSHIWAVHTYVLWV